MFSLAVTATGAAHADGRRQVLQSFPAAPYSYELAQEGCPRPGGADAGDGAACAFAVRLLEGGKPLDHVTLAQPGCGPASPTSVSRLLGANRDAKAWTTSDDNCEIQVAARTVGFGPKATALLVTELQGLEYRYRTHALYGLRNGALAVLWHFDEDAIGSHSTTTTVIPGGPGRQDVAFIDVERDAKGVARKVDAMRLHADVVTGQIAGDPLPDATAPLFVVQVGGFKSLRAARAGRVGCLHDLLLLRGALLPGLRLPAFFLGDVYARRDDADAAHGKLATCAEAKNVSRVHEYRASKGRPKGKTNAGHH